MKVFIKKAMQWGAKLVPSKGKHLKFRDNLGHQISAPKTSSDWRSIKNFESELRRKGFVNQNTATKVKDALPSTTTKPKVKEIKLSSQQRRLGASANRKAGGLSLQNFMRKVEGKDLIQPTPTSRTTIKSLPASKLGKPAPKVPTAPRMGLTQRKLKPSTPSSERMTKAFDDKLDALIQSVRNSPRRRVNRLEKSSTTTTTTSRRTPKGERKKISRAELDGMNIPQKQKDELIKQGLVNEGAALALKAGSSLIPKIMTGIGAVGTVLQASKADKERRRQLAKDNNLDITKPGDRAKLGRLLKKDTEAKKRAEKGDTRSQEQYRQEKAENRKTIDATRQQMGQSKAQPGTKKRAEIDKKLKDFRDELRDVTNDPIVPSRAKVRVKVGQEVPKPTDTLPKRTGASPQRVRDRRSYEAQQRRNLKENKFRVAAQLMRKAGVRNYDDLTRTVNTIKQQVGDKIIQSLRTPKQPTKKGLELQGRMSRAVDKNKDKYPGLFEDNKHREDKLNYQYKEVTNPKKPVDVIKALKLKKV